MPRLGVKPFVTLAFLQWTGPRTCISLPAYIRRGREVHLRTTRRGTRLCCDTLVLRMAVRVRLPKTCMPSLGRE